VIASTVVYVCGVSLVAPHQPYPLNLLTFGRGSGIATPEQAGRTAAAPVPCAAVRRRGCVRRTAGAAANAAWAAGAAAHAAEMAALDALVDEQEEDRMDAVAARGRLDYFTRRYADMLDMPAATECWRMRPWTMTSKLTGFGRWAWSRSSW
jgi:hypothetical protein